MKSLTSTFVFMAILVLVMSSCQSFELNRFYKKINLSHQEWKGEVPVEFQFEILDSNLNYSTLLYLQHDDLYPYANFWAEITVKFEEEEEVLLTQRLEVNLYDAKGNTLGTGTQDMIQHTIPFKLEAPFRFNREGMYTISIKQMMRTDPLPMIAVGLLVEKLGDYNPIEKEEDEVEEEIEQLYLSSN